MAKVKNYYAGSHSSVGFYSLYDEALSGLGRLYILKGGPGTGKSTFMRKVGLSLMDKGYSLEYLHCASDNKAIDGIIAPELGIGFVDGTAPHVIEPKYPGIVEKIINLGEYRNDHYLQKFRNPIISITDDISENYQAAYKVFSEAKEFHMEKEEIYLSAMDFKKADSITNSLLIKIFDRSFQSEDYPIVKKRFFGASTPKGSVNFIENITEDVHTRYLIKGRPGSGKSTLMKKIGDFAEKQGLSVEYFPCAFDPSSMDMVIIPSLSVALIDGTVPHVVDPFRLNDEIVDMFDECIHPDIEVERKMDLDELSLSYHNKIALGTNFLSEAKRLHDKLEEYYNEAMDFQAIDEKREEIIDSLYIGEQKVGSE